MLVRRSTLPTRIEQVAGVRPASYATARAAPLLASAAGGVGRLEHAPAAESAPMTASCSNQPMTSVSDSDGRQRIDHISPRAPARGGARAW